MAAVPHSARMLPHIKARPGVNSGRSLHGHRLHSGSPDIPNSHQRSRTKLCTCAFKAQMPKMSAHWADQSKFDCHPKAKHPPEATNQRGLQSCIAHALHARPLKGRGNLGRFLSHPLALCYVKD